MTEFTVEEQNAIGRAQQLSHYRKLRNTFAEVFGLPGKRTPHGAIILAELERFCGTRKLINETDLSGSTDVPRTFRKHVRCDVMQAIHDLIEWKETEDVNPSGTGT